MGRAPGKPTGQCNDARSVTAGVKPSKCPDIGKAAIDISGARTQLLGLTIFELRGEWWRLHRTPPAMRLSRDVLIRGITV